ncbi:hypothetical protein IF2G_10527 [Cordyceps javanica]|nr:hypothetical protein IF2G_10527 [Cordyceps javanica]
MDFAVAIPISIDSALWDMMPMPRKSASRCDDYGCCLGVRPSRRFARVRLFAEWAPRVAIDLLHGAQISLLPTDLLSMRQQPCTVPLLRIELVTTEPHSVNAAKRQPIEKQSIDVGRLKTASGLCCLFNPSCGRFCLFPQSAMVFSDVKLRTHDIERHSRRAPKMHTTARSSGGCGRMGSDRQGLCAIRITVCCQAHRGTSLDLGLIGSKGLDATVV